MHWWTWQLHVYVCTWIRRYTFHFLMSSGFRFFGRYWDMYAPVVYFSGITAVCFKKVVICYKKYFYFESFVFQTTFSAGHCQSGVHALMYYFNCSGKFCTSSYSMIWFCLKRSIWGLIRPTHKCICGVTGFSWIRYTVKRKFASQTSISVYKSSF